MPIYEYECTRCGQIEEAIQKFSDRPLNKCTQCSGKLQRLISHSSFHLKGTGWYVTDYAGKTGDTSSPKRPSEAPSTETAKETSAAEPKKAAKETSEQSSLS